MKAPLKSLLLLLILGAFSVARAIEIPLEKLTPVRIGYIDLQKVFDAYPEKSFAEGDLLRDIEKRKKELVRRQTTISTLRQQIAADQSALDQAAAGQAVSVPGDQVASLEASRPAVEAAPAPSPPVISSGPAGAAASSATAAQPYPSDEPLLGLPGHEYLPSVSSATAHLPAPTPQPMPKATASPLLDSLAASTAPVTLNAQATAALQKRVDDNRRTLDRALYAFKDYRAMALDDMKSLQKQKTYGVMSKIYAVLQGLARDENITVVLDKSYVLYGEDAVDLSDKLISRLNQPGALQ